MKVRVVAVRCRGKSFFPFAGFFQGGRRMSENIFSRICSRESVFLNRNAILPTFTPERLPFREKQIEDMSSHLAALAMNQRAPNLFLYGKVGTGKTVCTRFVTAQLESFAKSRGIDCVPVYVNCRTYASKYKTLLRIARELGNDRDFAGHSAAFVFEKITDAAMKNKRLVLILDEIDKVIDVDELVYALSRANDELPPQSSITLVAISNNALLKNRLDARTKSSLCEHEIVFSPYSGLELEHILSERVTEAFKPGVVGRGAIGLAAALAARESGDCRAAVLMLMRAGELADQQNATRVEESHVRGAQAVVERELVYRMIATLPRHHQMVLYAIADLSASRQGVQNLSGRRDEGLLFSGDVYEQYRSLAGSFGDSPVSARWYREAIGELETYGVISSSASGKGIRGQTRLLRLAVPAPQLRLTLDHALREPAPGIAPSIGY